MVTGDAYDVSGWSRVKPLFWVGSVRRRPCFDKCVTGDDYVLGLWRAMLPLFSVVVVGVALLSVVGDQQQTCYRFLRRTTHM